MANTYSRDFGSYNGSLFYEKIPGSKIADELDMRIEEFDIDGVDQAIFNEALSTYDAYVETEGDLTEDVAVKVLRSTGLL